MEITVASEPSPAADKVPVSTATFPPPSRLDQGLRWFTSILLLIFPTATLFVNRGDSVVLGLLTLIGIWVWLRDGARRWLDRPSALLWLAFVLFFAVALLSYLLGTQADAGFRFLGRYLRFLLIVPVYLALRRYPPTAKTVFIGLALGSLLAGAIGGLHVYHADAFIRIEATTGQPIIFGDLATTMTLCVVAGFGLLAVSRKSWAVPVLMVCVAGGTAATLMSGARGAWIPLLLMPPMLMTRFGGFLKARHVVVIVLVLVAVFFAFYFVAQSGTRSRIVDASTSLRGYFVALQHIDTRGDGTPADPVCLSEPKFLRAWLNAARTVAGTLDAAVVADSRLARVAGCRTDYVLRLYNPSNTVVTQQIFSRVPNHEASGQHTELLMRGVGTIEFADGAGKLNTTSNSRNYLRYSLVDRTAVGERLNVFVGPGRTVWLVPLDSYPGEYSLSIADTSVGMRLEMWRGAWEMFVHHPLLGVGTGVYQDRLAQLIQGGEIFPFVSGFDHPHSDYFNALSSAGIVGFLALLAVLAIPFLHFWRALRNKDAASHAVGLAGALTVIGFAIYALTDTIFLHSMMITWYVIYMALFYALLDVRANKLAKPPLPTP